MNNSLDRLHAGIAASLAERVLPHVADEFARGQVFGIIYLLRCMNLRTGWSETYLGPRLSLVQNTAAALAPMLATLPRAPAIETARSPTSTLHDYCTSIAAALEAAYDWVERHAGDIETGSLASIRGIWQRYIEADLRLELALRAPLPYSEMSTGQANTAGSEAS